MQLDFWQALGVVSGALIAVMTLIGLLWRWVVRPVFQTIKRLNRVADDLLGDRERRIPSLTERVVTQTAATEQNSATLARLADQVTQQGHRIDEHLSWHSGGGRLNGLAPAPVTPRPAGRQ